MNGLNGIGQLIPTGSTLPSSWGEGQLFWQETTGRKILFSYANSKWNPEHIVGDATFYIDNVNGTDDYNHGFASGTDAFKTIAFMSNLLMAKCEGNISIYLSNNTYSESINFVGLGKSLTSGTHIYFNGTPNQTANITATGGSAGATPSSFPNVTVASPDSGQIGNIIEFTSGTNNGQMRVIGYTDATHYWLVGDVLPATPANGDTFIIMSPGTEISGGAWQFDHCAGIKLTFLNFSGGNNLNVWGNCGYMQMTQCWISGTAGANNIFIADNSYLDMWNVSGIKSTSDNAVLIQCETGAQLQLHGCRFAGYATGTGILIMVNTGAMISYVDSSEFLDAYEIQGQYDATISFQGNSGMNSFIHGMALPVNIIGHSFFVGQSNIVLGLEIDNSTADANSGTYTSDGATSYSAIFAT